MAGKQRAKLGDRDGVGELPDPNADPNADSDPNAYPDSHSHTVAVALPFADAVAITVSHTHPHTDPHTHSSSSRTSFTAGPVEHAVLTDDRELLDAYVDEHSDGVAGAEVRVHEVDSAS